MTAKRPERKGVQLCTPLQDKHIQEHCSVNVFYQPKLRGNRGLVEWMGADPIILSSYQNKIEWMHHIEDALIDLVHELGFKLVFDGELYKPGYGQEAITGACKCKKDPYKRKMPLYPDQMEFHIYDFRPKNKDSYLRQDVRMHVLDVVKHSVPKNSPLKIVSTYRGLLSTWQDYAERFLLEGYEGLVIRHPGSTYLPAPERSSLTWKWKPSEIDTYTIVAVNEGTGWAVGMVGSFDVKDRHGNVFSVGSGLYKDDRILYWKIRDTLPGKLIDVKHEPVKTINGFPICTAFVRDSIREG